MRSKKSLYNLLTAILLQMVTLTMGIVLPRVMILSFGSEINGLVSSIRQFISYLTLVEAGLAGASIFALYKPLAEKNNMKINEILSETKKFYNKSGIWFSILAFLLALIFPYIANSKTISNIEIIIIAFILGINGSLEFFSMGKYRTLLTADQKSYIISLIQIVGQLINGIIIVIMSIKGFNIISVQLIATSSYIIRTILFKNYVKHNYKFIRFNIKVSKNILHQRADVLFHQIGGMVVFNSPIALITFFCSLTEVSIYSIYNMIFIGISGILGIFNNGLVAGLGDIISRNDLNRLQKVYREYEFIYYMLVTGVYSCTYILIMPFIKIYTKGLDDAQYIDKNLAMAFIIIGILNVLRTPQATVVNAAGYFKETRYRALIEIIINIIFSIVLINIFGMIGVLIGGICSYLYRTVDFIMYVPKKITYLPIKQSVIRILRAAFLGYVIIIPFNNFIFIQAKNFYEWVLYGISISIWAGFIIIIGNYLLEKNQMLSIFERIKMLTSKKKIKI